MVIVDETSMVSLSLMARLIEALRSDARLVLVGDPGQLASIEAGAVLGDIVGPAGRRRAGRPCRAIGDGIVVLDRVHRFGGGIAQLAAAIRPGDADAVMDLLRDPPEGVRWIEADVADEAALASLAPVRDGALAAARRVIDGRRGRRGREALSGARRVPDPVRAPPRALRRGELDGADGGLAAGATPRGSPASERWYAGRPLLVVENDYELRLYNGDTGVVVRRRGDRLVAAFPRGGEIVRVQPGAAGRGRDRLRDDDPQEPGLAVRRRRRAAARAGLADPHPGAALHRGHPGPAAADRGPAPRRRSARACSGRWRGPRGCAGGCGATADAGLPGSTAGITWRRER